MAKPNPPDALGQPNPPAPTEDPHRAPAAAALALAAGVAAGNAHGRAPFAIFDDDTRTAYAAAGALIDVSDEEIAAQVARAADDPERGRIASVAGVPETEVFAWRCYPDRLVVVTTAGEKLTVVMHCR